MTAYPQWKLGLIDSAWFGSPYEGAPGKREAKKIGFDSLDLPETDTDIALAAQRLARVEYVAAFDDEIELVVRPHGAARRPGGSERKSTR